jgi:beta-galactosidase
MMRKLILLASLALPGAAAERYNEFLFGVAYYPEHWPESYWERDARMMKEAGVNVVRMGEFAWYLMEPREGVYDFALFDRAIATLARHGIKTILGTPTAAPPKWLTSKYPEALGVFPNGRAADDQTRRHACYNSPVYRRLSKRIVEEMAAHYRDNSNVAGWQIDNEFNCGFTECYSGSCRTAFREWLRGRYGDLPTLNEAWGTAFWSQWYNAWGQVDLPFPAPAPHNPALMLDFKRFISDSVESFQHDQVETLRRVRPNDFITHNGYFKNIDYHKMSRDLDLFAFDNYPCFLEKPQYVTGAKLTMSRGYRDRFMIMEQQTAAGGQTYLLKSPRPGEMSLWAFQTIAHGADGVVHFRWRTARKGIEEYWGGVLSQDNVARARYREFKKEGAEIRKIGREILGSRVASDIAAIKDFEAEWVFDHQTFTPEVKIDNEYVDLFQAASEAKQNIDFIGRHADFDRYRIIFAPHLILMDAELAQKIRRFVERGGTFILGAHSAVKNRQNAMTDHVQPILVNDVFGVEVAGFQCYQPPSAKRNGIRFPDGGVVPVHVFADELELRTAKAAATWDRDYLKGKPALTENGFGKGKAVYYASFFNLEAARRLMGRYVAASGLKPIVEGAPAQIEATRRTKGRTGYTFLLNHGASSVTVKLGEGYFDMLAGAAAPAAITLRPLGYKVLRKAR